MVPNIGLESIYLVVGSLKLIARGSKLICKFLSGLSCLSKIRLNRTSSPGDEPKNCIPRPVQQIRRTGIFRFEFIRNSGFNIGFQRRRIYLLASHCSPRTQPAPDYSAYRNPSLRNLTAVDKIVVCFLGNGSRILYRRWQVSRVFNSFLASEGTSYSLIGDHCGEGVI